MDTDRTKGRFVLRKGTVDAVLDLRRLSEKSKSKNRKLFCVVVDLGC